MKGIRKAIRKILFEQKVVKRHGTDFSGGGDHLVLPFSAVIDPTTYPDFPYRKTGEEPISFQKEYSRTHPDGWTITGVVTDWEDYFQGVTDFRASHPKFGSVYGNFDTEVVADNERGYDDFYAKHPPIIWDPSDI
jgi:hypothetical protein